MTFQYLVRSHFFCLEQFESSNLQFRFWLPDCSLSALGRILWFHTNGEDHSDVISKIELKISTSGKMGVIFTKAVKIGSECAPSHVPVCLSSYSSSMGF